MIEVDYIIKTNNNLFHLSIYLNVLIIPLEKGKKCLACNFPLLADPAPHKFCFVTKKNKNPKHVKHITETYRQKPLERKLNWLKLQTTVLK